MLTPSTRASIRPRSLSTSVIPPTQARSLFYQGWRSPRNATYESQHDPLYPRLNRHHTMKARAKLARSVRRRQHFDWDVDAKPFVGPKHVRLASHWNGRYGPRWGRYNENQDNQNKNDIDNNEHELNEREKAWKKDLENLRKRIESDPYEAVFGKRFEPFWSPLLRQWVGEESTEPKKDLNNSATNSADSKSSREKSTPPVQPRKQPEASKPIDVRQPSKPAHHYAYSSSASWDSKTNKTKKSEWDSISGETKHYEYDPVSGRMVLVEAPQKNASQQQNAEIPASVTWKPVVGKQVTKETPAIIENVDISAKQVENEQPTLTYKPSRTVPLEAIETPDPSKVQEAGLDALTADDVRASMGKTKHQCFDPSQVTEEWKAGQDLLRQQVKEWDDSVTRLRNEVTAIVDKTAAIELGRYLPTTLDRRASAPKPTQKDNVLQPALQRMQTKARPQPTDLDDAAAHESTEPIAQPLVMPKGWSEQADILQSDRVKRTTSQRPYPTMRWLDDMNARKAAYEKQRAIVDAELARTNAKEIARLEKLNESLKADVDAQKLAMSEQQDRSAGKIRSLRGELETAYKQSSVHADAFRDRILTLEKELSVAQNTANDVSVKAIRERYSEKIRGLKSELDIAYKQSSVHADEFTQRIKTLEAELSHLTHIAGGASPKITPRQNSTSGRSSQVDSVRATKQLSDKTPSKSNATTVQGEGDFSPDVVKYADSDKWYKQSSPPPQPTAEQIAKAQQKLHDEDLVKEVKCIYENAYGTIDAEHKQPATPRDPALEKALERQDMRANYGYKDDKLGEQLAAEARGPIKNPSIQERVLFGYKEDGSELKAPKVQSKLETKWKDQWQPVRKASGNKDYAYKPDGLEVELRSQSKSADSAKAEQERYAYKPDDLEAQLKNQTTPTDMTKAEKERYAYKKDNLEAQLKSQGNSNYATKTEKAYVYKPDDLEAELKSQGKSKVAEEADKRYAYTPDDLEAQLQSQSSSTAKPEKEYAYKPDDLESELQSQSKPKEAAKPDKRDIYKPDDLETQLQSQNKSSSPKSRRWTKVFANLQREGFQVVQAREDLLVLKKIHEPEKAATAQPLSQTDVNPVDGTSRHSQDVHTATGNYASPTGFLDFDPVRDGSASQPNHSRSKKLLWVLGVGGTAATVAYFAGALAEKAEQARREKYMMEVFGNREKQAEERRMRWRLDEGIWKKGS